MKAVSKSNSLKHYMWGKDCDGWNLVETEALSIKQERMPANTSEEMHFHKYARQFFFILKGSAAFEINNEVVELKEGEGLEISPGDKHKIMNNTNSDLEFILCSQPWTVNDRINVI